MIMKPIIKKGVPTYHIPYTIYQMGQSLFEVILALAILAVIITGIVSLTSTSVNTSTYSRNVSQANRYADEVIEAVRKYKEFNEWTVFSNDILAANTDPALPDVWCVTDVDSLFSTAGVCASTDIIAGTIFQRTLTATLADPTNSNSIDITVAVIWTDDKGTHTTKSSTTISNW